MSYTNVLNFDFDLDPSAPDWVLELFQVLARGEILPNDILEHLDEKTQDYFSNPDAFMGRSNLGSPVLVWQTGLTNEEGDAPLATHHVNFVVHISDDGYANGGYFLPFAFFEFVAVSGVYCVEWTDVWRNIVTHFYKDGEDTLVVQLETKDFPSPLSPHERQDPNRNLYGWKPTQQSDFKISIFQRLTPDERGALWQT